jgi:hypothetical protein
VTNLENLQRIIVWKEAPDEVNCIEFLSNEGDELITLKFSAAHGKSGVQSVYVLQRGACFCGFKHTRKAGGGFDFVPFFR